MADSNSSRLENRPDHSIHCPGGDCGLNDHQRSGLEGLSEPAAGRFECAVAGPVVAGIDRGLDGNDDDVGVVKHTRVARRPKLA